MSPRTNFQRELEQLSDSLREMADSVEENYEKLFAALEDKNKEEVMEIAGSEKVFGDMQRAIESQCLFLITKQQPIASDLRVVTANLKVVTDIERVGDHVVDMAELILRLNMTDLSAYSRHLEPMIREAKKMVHDAVEAFIGRNMEAAEEVIAEDDIVDELFNKVKEDLIVLLKNEGKDADECIDIIMLTKYLEKIGDHAVNIGEWEIFQETGNMKDVRLL